LVYQKWDTLVCFHPYLSKFLKIHVQNDFIKILKKNYTSMSSWKWFGDTYFELLTTLAGVTNLLLILINKWVHHYKFWNCESICTLFLYCYISCHKIKIYPIWNVYIYIYIIYFYLFIFFESEHSWIITLNPFKLLLQ